MIFTAALFTIAEIWSQAKYPSTWIKKMWYVYTMEYYSALIKEILPLVIMRINLEDIMLSEISQIQNDRYYWVGQKVCLGVS